MLDDYVYQSLELPPKNEGPFGFAGRPSEGSQGYGGAVVDAGPTSAVDSGASVLPSGDAGSYGGYYSGAELLPDGLQGDMLVYRNKAWVAFAKPQDGAILAMDSFGNPYWITGDQHNALVYYDSDLNYWVQSNGPTGPGNVFITNADGDLQWLPQANTEGTYVLGSVNGVVQWIATQDCDAPEP